MSTQITGGDFKGRLLEVPPSKTRPTQARIRQALFSVIEHHSGLDLGARFNSVIDLCAGSGALGLEALSRGIEQCLFVDSSKDSIHIIRKNCQSLQLSDSRATFLKGDGLKIISKPRQLPELRGPYLILCDPPYNQKSSLWIESIAQSEYWKDQSFCMFESSKKDTWMKQGSFPQTMKLSKQKEYSETLISFFQFNDGVL